MLINYDLETDTPIKPYTMKGFGFNCPSDAAAKKVIELSERHQMNMKALIKPRTAAQTYDPEKSRRWEETNQGTQKVIDDLQGQIDMVKSFKTLFGRLYASSGYRTKSSPRFSSVIKSGKPTARKPVTGEPTYNYFLDWCLLEIAPTRTMDNVLTFHDQPEWFKLAPGEPMNEWTTLDSPSHHIDKEDLQVFKLGGTTGSTQGIINPVPEVINPDSQIGKAGGLTDKNIRHAFTIHPVDKGELFSKDGDSGSIVMEMETGRWLGLLFGQNEMHDSLMIPIDVVLRDIEMVTGLTVVEPRFTA